MHDKQSQNPPLKPFVRRDVIRGEGCGWDGRVAGADEQRVMDGLSVAWRIDGLSDSLAWRVMAGLSVTRRIVLWSAEFYGRPRCVWLPCCYSVLFVAWMACSLLSNFLLVVCCLRLLFVVGSRFLDSTQQQRILQASRELKKYIFL